MIVSPFYYIFPTHPDTAMRLCSAVQILSSRHLFPFKLRRPARSSCTLCRDTLPVAIARAADRMSNEAANTFPSNPKRDAPSSDTSRISIRASDTKTWLVPACTNRESPSSLSDKSLAVPPSRASTPLVTVLRLMTPPWVASMTARTTLPTRTWALPVVRKSNSPFTASASSAEHPPTMASNLPISPMLTSPARTESWIREERGAAITISGNADTSMGGPLLTETCNTPFLRTQFMDPGGAVP